MPSPARAVVLNAMSYLVSTFISPPWSARPDHPAGGTGGGTGPCAGCSPRSARSPFLGDAPCDDSSTFSAGVKSLLTAGLRRLRSGGALCRPLSLTGTLSQLKGEPWREATTSFGRVCDHVRGQGGSLTPRLPRLCRCPAIDVSARGHHRETVAAFCRRSVALSAAESAGDAFTLARSWREHAAHQTAYAWKAVGPAHRAA